MKFLDRFKKGPRGLFVLNIYRRGELIERVEDKNLIVDGSKLIHAKLLGGDVTNRSVTQFGVGTNGAAPAGGNTALTGAYVKNVDLVEYPSTNQVAFDFSLTTAEANGMAILEFGLLTQGGVLYARKIRAQPLNKANDISFSGTWTISF